MLLDFKVKNYKVFLDEANFSLIPAPKQSGLDYSILKKKIGKKESKALCSSVIYGPNAAGKSNIISAMDTFKSIVLRGNIKDADYDKAINPASVKLSLIPNITLNNSKPIEFYIDFIEEGFRFQYELHINVGTFLSEGKRSVQFERLKINEFTIYERDTTLQIFFNKGFDEMLLDSTKLSKSCIEAFAEESLNNEELFLTNGFKLLVSTKFSKIINDWFTNKFKIVYHADQAFLKPSVKEEKVFYSQKSVNEAIKAFGVESNEIGYIIKEKESEPMLCSLIKRDTSGLERYAIDSRVFESFGTIRFVNLLPLLLDAFKHGSTLVIDEFDASIHPMVIMNIINIFHNDEINKNHAQLIFNTHNPIFLNSNLFRRDEIKFVERDKDTYKSAIYALSDFKTAGKEGVRKGDDYMKSYFVNRFGAINDVDFSPIFEEVVSMEGRE